MKIAADLAATTFAAVAIIAGLALLLGYLLVAVDAIAARWRRR